MVVRCKVQKPNRMKQGYVIKLEHMWIASELNRGRPFCRQIRKVADLQKRGDHRQIEQEEKHGSGSEVVVVP